MAAQSNINVAREFIQANKQALADMGVAAKELDKIEQIPNSIRNR